MYEVVDAGVKMGCLRSDTLTRALAGSDDAVVRGRAIALDPAVLRSLYCDEKQSMREVARVSCCSETTIRRRLIAVGIQSRARGPFSNRDASSIDAP